MFNDQYSSEHCFEALLNNIALLEATGKVDESDVGEKGIQASRGIEE